MSRIRRYKLVIVGDGACGKTSILTVFKTGEFLTRHIPTIFETDVATVQLPNDEEVELVLWDTAGQEDYDRLRPLSYPSTDVILMCCSVDRPESLYHIESKWIKEVRHFCKGVPIILVANKIDLRDNAGLIKSLAKVGKFPVPTDQLKHVKDRLQIDELCECSAKTKEGINHLFQTAAKSAISRSKRGIMGSGKWCPIL